jgi:two-component system sensor kinase FixL
MGELTASIAHEINQPMSAILANVDAAEMLLDADRLEGGELRAILEDIRNDDLRAADVIRQLRGLANKRQLVTEAFDARELVAAVLRLVAPIARGRHVSIDADFSALPRVRGDRIHVQQVLLNLIFNGMDAMADAPLEDRRLRVRAWAADPDLVEIAVSDRGHGIPQGQEHKIFERFHTTKPDGLGLGLPIARSLVQAHGGTIWGRNNPDRGATFHFTIPAA